MILSYFWPLWEFFYILIKLAFGLREGGREGRQREKGDYFIIVKKCTSIYLSNEGFVSVISSDELHSLAV